MFDDLFKSLISSSDDDRNDDYRYGTSNDSHDQNYRDDHETYGRLFSSSSDNKEED